MDERAEDAQREALQKVFSGQAGGWMGVFAELVGEVRGLEFVPITFEVAADLAHWRAEIPGKLKAFAQALSGPTTPPGARVQLLNAPGSEVGPGQVMTWGTAVDNEVDAFGLQWSWAGQSSKHIPFDWSGPGQPQPRGDATGASLRAVSPLPPAGYLGWSRLSVLLVLVLLTACCKT